MTWPHRPSAPASGWRTLLAAALVVAGLLGAPGARAADVHGDEQGDRYVGTGALLLPGSVDEESRRRAAACGDCSWRMSTPCVASVLGNSFGDGCGSVVRGCPGGELLRAWLRRPGAPWTDLGLSCLRPGGPVTTVEAARRVTDRIEAGIPALLPRFQPEQGVVTQLPVMFRSGQQGGEHRWRTSIAGLGVDITAVPHWTWEFGDGGTVSSAESGSTAPSAIQHVYRTAGSRRVEVVTRWSASFTVDDLGPFPVLEPVTQTATAVVAVGEGRALLTTPAP